MPPNQASSPVATAADVRAKLTHVLRLDLVGPEPDDAQVNEGLSGPPSRWYGDGLRRRVHRHGRGVAGAGVQRGAGGV